MANVMRHRRYDSNALEMAIALASVVYIGDMVTKTANKAVAVSATAIDPSKTDKENAGVIADTFAGIAATASKATDDEKLVVGQNGDWEMPCASTDWKVGDWVGIDNDGANFYDQKVLKVDSKSQSIGRCVLEEASATTVLFRLRTSLSVEDAV